jgi:hypothetical protein
MGKAAPDGADDRCCNAEPEQDVADDLKLVGKRVDA